jgi:hypothetical protein
LPNRITEQLARYSKVGNRSSNPGSRELGRIPNCEMPFRELHLHDGMWITSAERSWLWLEHNMLLPKMFKIHD